MDVDPFVDWLIDRLVTLQELDFPAAVVEGEALTVGEAHEAVQSVALVESIQYALGPVEPPEESPVAVA